MAHPLGKRARYVQQQLAARGKEQLYTWCLSVVQKHLEEAKARSATGGGLVNDHLVELAEEEAAMRVLRDQNSA